MKIAIFGGTFNPLHIGHVMLADQVIKELCYDKVIFVPSNIPPHKKNENLVDAVHRFNMIKSFCNKDKENKKHFIVEDCEIKRGGVSYTIDTLLYLEEKYKNQKDEKFGFIMGDEVASEFHKWKAPEKIASKVDFIITHRYQEDKNLFSEGEKNEPLQNYKGDFNTSFETSTFPYNHIYLSEPLLPVSSTTIRSKIKNGKSFKYLVPKSVYEYIIKKGLYKSNL